MQEIQLGHHIGRVKDYAITETKAGDPQVAIQFDIEFNDVGGGEVDKYTKTLTWFGSLKPGKAEEITLKALATLKMQGNDPLGLGDGISSGLISAGQEAMLTIEENDYSGKRTAKIAWINAPEGGGGLGKRITAAEAKAKFAGRNFTGNMAAVKAKMGVEDDLGF